MKIISVPCSFDNYSYLIICTDTQKAAVVDPTEAYPVMVEIEANKAQLVSVLCTHHHHDHIGGAEDLMHEYSNLEVICHSSDKHRVSAATAYVDDGDTVQVGNLRGHILHTPGHTSGSICYHFKNHLFCGDTLFGGGCGRLFEGTPEQMYRSLTEKIAPLADDTHIYFGHEYTRLNLQFARTVEPSNPEAMKRMEELEQGDTISTPSTLLLEKQTNPFLRTDVAEIKQILKAKHYVNVDDSVDVFSMLRQLRNSF